MSKGNSKETKPSSPKVEITKVRPALDGKVKGQVPRMENPPPPPTKKEG